MENENKTAVLQAGIDLAGHISAIAEGVVIKNDANIKGIRNNRKREQRRTHIDFMFGGDIDE